MIEATYEDRKLLHRQTYFPCRCLAMLVTMRYVVGRSTAVFKFLKTIKTVRSNQRCVVLLCCGLVEQDCVPARYLHSTDIIFSITAGAMSMY